MESIHTLFARPLFLAFAAFSAAIQLVGLCRPGGNR